VADAPALITDSSACVPPSSVDRHGVAVVPISVQIGSSEYRDGVDLKPEALYQALARGQSVKSAAPSAFDYLDAVEAGGRPAVIVTPAREFTHMYRNAALAAEMASVAVTVVDSRSATAGHGLVVMAAAEAREAGGGVDDVVAAAEDASERVDLVACLESLDHLRESGRVPAMALGLANHLGLRPVFRMRDGIAERVALPRSERGALDRLVRSWREGGGRESPRSAVFHAARPDRAHELSQRLGGATFVTEFSAAMGIHTGPGLVGVAWLRPADLVDADDGDGL
jgi:DegV family protein with EDD domain